MKTRLALLAPAALLLGLLCMASCAEPLENPISTNSSEDPITILDIDTVYITDTVILQDTLIVEDSSGQSDTVIVVDTMVVIDTLVFGDTIIVVDTLVIVDTLVQEDTVVITDTLVQIDTVVVVDTVIICVPDSAQTMCRRLSTLQCKIIWYLQNNPGRYRLEFSSETKYGSPPAALNVRVDGKEHTWMRSESEEFFLEVDMGPDATIKVWPDYSLAACGWALDICVTITPL
jgi:hypothetical protein